MWNHEQISQLIELYHNYPCPYSTKSKDYHNKYKRSLALDNICESLSALRPGTTAAEVQNKFQGLRTTYTSERKKVLETLHSGMGECEAVQPTLWYYEKLSYLNEHLQLRGSKCCFVIPKPDFTDPETCHPLTSHLEEEVVEYNVTEASILSPSTSSQSCIRPASNQLESLETPAGNTNLKSKRRKISPTAEIEMNVLSDISNGLKTISTVLNKSESGVERTAEDAMGEFVAMQLKLIKNEALKQDIQLEIVQLIGEAIKNQ